MTRRLPFVLAAVAALLLLLPATGQAASKRPEVVVGIADQKPDMFFDQRFRDLGVRHARIQVGWDVMRNDWELDRLDHWLFYARIAGVEPLVSFGHSRLERRQLPKPERFQREFRRLRKRYPWVRSFATWNEANHCGEPTCKRPKLVAAYFRKLRQACPKRCTILAAELLDMPNMLRWVRDFRRHSKVEPRFWALHNYVEANRFKTTSLRSLLRRTKGEIWLTEVGGIVKRRNVTTSTVRRIPESQWHAQRVTRYLFDEVVPLDRRITRIYLYHWNSSTARDSWDSALIDHRGRRRPAFKELQKALRRLELRSAARR